MGMALFPFLFIYLKKFFYIDLYSKAYFMYVSKDYDSLSSIYLLLSMLFISAITFKYQIQVLRFL